MKASPDEPRKILVGIANHGHRNLRYLQELLKAYRALPWKTDIVVFSDIPKDFGPDITVQVGLPTKDPWSLPFGHKEFFAKRLHEYDLFIYSEDDTLLTERNIRAFLKLNNALPESQIGGFLRYETDEEGTRYFPEIHGPFHWDPATVATYGTYTVAFFSNDHSACYILTRQQLQRAIDSGGYLTPPHSERYDLLVSAATDPYTRCGMRRMICISHLDDFLIHHLPNKYIGDLGLDEPSLQLQLQALGAVRKSEEADRVRPWLATETKLPGLRWSKSYYEATPTALIEMLPTRTNTVLSIGAGWGELESTLLNNGIDVTAIALDGIISACASARGVNVINGPMEAASDQLAGREFDAVVCSNLLHLATDPVALIRQCAHLMAPGGVFIASIPNMTSAKTIWGRIFARNEYEGLSDFAISGVHIGSEGRLRDWIKAGGLVPEGLARRYSPREQWWNKITLGLFGQAIASQVFLSARKVRSHA